MTDEERKTQDEQSTEMIPEKGQDTAVASSAEASQEANGQVITPEQTPANKMSQAASVPSTVPMPKADAESSATPYDMVTPQTPTSQDGVWAQGQPQQPLPPQPQLQRPIGMSYQPYAQDQGYIPPTEVPPVPPVPPVPDATQEQNVRKHDPLLIGLSIGGLALGVIALFVACAGNAYITNVEHNVNVVSQDVDELKSHVYADDATNSGSLFDRLFGDKFGKDDGKDNVIGNDDNANYDGKSSETDGSEGYLGVRVSDTEGGGAYVLDVIKGSPADDAGIEKYDNITKFGDTEISDQMDLIDAVADSKPGDKVDVTVVRMNKEKEVSVTIGDKAELADEEGSNDSKNENDTDDSDNTTDNGKADDKSPSDNDNKNDNDADDRNTPSVKEREELSLGGKMRKG